MVWFTRKILFSDVAAQVLDLKKVRSKGTQEAAKYPIRRLRLNFGHILISEISELKWTDYIDREWKKGRRYFSEDRKFMRMILLHALKQEWIPKDLKLSIPDVPKSAGREITRDERTRLLKHADWNLRFQIDIALHLGLRRKEMLSLHRDQIDFERNLIVLQADETKTRRKRIVPIHPRLLTRFKKRFACNGSRYLFPSRWDPNRPLLDNKKTWGTCKRKAGVNVRWHDWRHTCATELLRAGNNRSIVGKLLGMSERVLEAIYAHLNVDDLREAVLSLRL